jgi:hypothetical protein
MVEGSDQILHRDFDGCPDPAEHHDWSPEVSIQAAGDLSFSVQVAILVGGMAYELGVRDL